ncbi:MAG: hypothetical protein C0412_14070, partial [Flavobacterium sp.]|nr:hypothetical protein [Flavobacterium sp.]
KLKKYLAPLLCGFSVGIIQNVPIVGNFTCCVILPIAAFYSLVLDRKANNYSGSIKYSKGLLFGFLTGAIAAFFGSFLDVMLTYFFKNNNFTLMVNDFIRTIDEFPLDIQLKKQMSDILLQAKEDITRNGFSAFYTISFTIDQLFINSIFGCIGGLVGTKILNSKKDRENNNQNNL